MEHLHEPDAIRRWAGAHGLLPALRTDLAVPPGDHPLTFDVRGEHTDDVYEVGWDEWLAAFAAGGLTLRVDPDADHYELGPGGGRPGDRGHDPPGS